MSRFFKLAPLLVLAILAVVFFVIKKTEREVATPLIGVRKEEKEEGEELVILAKNLRIPWEMAILPNNRILLTERPGDILLIDTGSTQEIKEVAHIGEGGLLGLALHPEFEKNKFIYLYYTYFKGVRLLNKVVRFKFEGEKLADEVTIIEEIPGSINHDGGRIKFGPDGMLYITTGDAQNPFNSQNLESLAGKILRLNDDGSIPEDNPFGSSPVYSYGHRNPQGLVWDSKGQLWATEHGSKGQDDVNVIKPGKNYGWPDIQGDEKKECMETPFVHSGEDTWAPSGATIYQGKLYFAGLAGRAIYEFDLEKHSLKKHFEGEFGRVRTINLGPDGYFYLLTSNRDGRNINPHKDDDRIIRVHPSVF